MPLFPSPSNAGEPIGRPRISTWLRKAEARAGLPKFNGGLWHPYRRLWATERQHLPDVVVAEAGGWRDLRSLKNSYQRERAEDVAAVVSLGRA